MSHPLWSTIQTPLQYLLAFYALLVLGFYFLSDSVIFAPPPASYKDNPNIIKIPLDDAKKISAIYLAHPQAKYTILFSHGNAEDLGHVLPFLQRFHQQGFSVFAYDYEGYGTSEGKPSEKNSYQDILAAYHYLTQVLKVPAQHIIVYGRSVGSGPSVHLVSQVPVKALILENAFLSAYRVKTGIPLIPFDKYPNLRTLSQTPIPLLLIASTKDSVIPFWHSKTLAEKAKGPTQTYWVQGADHNNILAIDPSGYWQAILNFSLQLDNHKQTGP